jgi:hypothetical protein
MNHAFKSMLLESHFDASLGSLCQAQVTHLHPTWFKIQL